MALPVRVRRVLDLQVVVVVLIVAGLGVFVAGLARVVVADPQVLHLVVVTRVARVGRVAGVVGILVAVVVHGHRSQSTVAFSPSACRHLQLRVLSAEWQLVASALHKQLRCKPQKYVTQLNAPLGELRAGPLSRLPSPQLRASSRLFLCITTEAASCLPVHMQLASSEPARCDWLRRKATPGSKTPETSRVHCERQGQGQRPRRYELNQVRRRDCG